MSYNAQNLGLFSADAHAQLSPPPVSLSLGYPPQGLSTQQQYNSLFASIDQVS
jgi:hypothetical protein